MGIPVSSNPFRAIGDLILSLPLQYYFYVNIVHSTYVRFQKVKEEHNFCQKNIKKKEGEERWDKNLIYVQDLCSILLQFFFCFSFICLVKNKVLFLAIAC